MSVFPWWHQKGVGNKGQTIPLFEREVTRRTNRTLSDNCSSSFEPYSTGHNLLFPFTKKNDLLSVLIRPFDRDRSFCLFILWELNVTYGWRYHIYEGGNHKVRWLPIPNVLRRYDIINRKCPIVLNRCDGTITVLYPRVHLCTSLWHSQKAKGTRTPHLNSFLFESSIYRVLTEYEQP